MCIFNPAEPHILILDYKHGVSVFGNEIYLIWLNAIIIDVDWSHQDDLCVMALEAAACLANQDWANSSVKNSHEIPSSFPLRAHS